MMMVLKMVDQRAGKMAAMSVESRAELSVV